MSNLDVNSANQIKGVISRFLDGSSASSISKDLNFLLNQYVTSDNFDGTNKIDKDLILEITRVTEFITELQELSR